MEKHNSYTIDSEGKIVYVDLRWDLFAMENGGKVNVLKDQILGKKILDFISGDHVRMWYESIISLARISGKTIERDYRCDSPKQKRYMRMIITPIKNNFIRVDHYLLKSEDIDADIDLDFEDNYDLKITRCSACNRFYYKERWVEINELVKHLDITKISVSDIICNRCIINHLIG